MPANTRMENCLAEERGSLIFWSPDAQQRKPGSKVQIIDVFSLQVVTGYTRAPKVGCCWSPSHPWLLVAA
jgi:hypothetical protein